LQAVFKIRNISSVLLLSVYIAVLLHDIVPHFHSDEAHKHDAQVVHQDHHHHDDDHTHSHQESKTPTDSHADEGVLHLLGHLLDGLSHAPHSGEHLADNSAKNEIPQAALRITFAFLVSALLPPSELDVVTRIPESPVPPYEQMRCSDVPLRGPPALS
jgi:ABC-type nickel/cobalt efflux system permease component RcnA